MERRKENEEKSIRIEKKEGENKMENVLVGYGKGDGKENMEREKVKIEKQL